MKIQLSLLLIFSVLLFACPPQEDKKTNSPGGVPVTTVPPKETTPKPIPPFEMDIPKGHTLINQASGDLNKDSIEENIVVLNTGQSGDFGEERIILIFKAQDGAWKLWHRSSGAIMSSENGGMMGDPFNSINVERGALVIKHFGGSSSKWDLTHRFRYQNDDWELIGFTSIGTYFTEFETFDYNLTSGNVIYKKEEIDGKGDVKKVVENKNFISKMEKLPSMDDFEFFKIFAVDSKTGTCYPPDACYARETGLDDPTIDDGSAVQSMNDLVGTYTLGGHDESWILDISKKGNNYEVNYFVLDGMLAFIAQVIKDTPTKTLKKFDVDFNTMTFDSDLGKGKIQMESGNNLQITFFDIESHIDDQLVLTHLGEDPSIDH